ncbi:MAG TPA: PAS domain-containing protein, partial [Bacteroidales bacterium]|nr:PAS domain-containing protein [Bacteroidales bacterium]
VEILFVPVLKAMADMTKKEEDILFPMSLDLLTTEDWYEIHKQTLEFGFTLYDPETDWKPEGIFTEDTQGVTLSHAGAVQLPSGSFTAEEIMAILNTVPVDMTFVDRNDKVKYFTQGNHRIFARNRSIINRDVRLCHPPGSVHIIEKILDDFKSGKADHAPFWINMKGKFILIEYFALRNEKGEYLGTLEVSQDLTEARKLKGEQRILSYKTK